MKFLNYFASKTSPSSSSFCNKVFSNAVKTNLNTSITSEYVNGEGKYDVATYSVQGPNLNDYNILDRLKNVSKPLLDFNFPKNNDKRPRKFRYKWLMDYSWLAYSTKFDRVFCTQCSLLHHKTKNPSSATSLITIGQKNWNDSVSTFRKHEKSVLHKTVNAILVELEMQNSGASRSIGQIISSEYSKTIADNRIFLSSIIDTIILCGRLAISLRGHRDNFNNFPEVGEYAPYSIGNFMDLLNFRVRAGDHALGKDLKLCSKNASYVSLKFKMN
jgi:hypothetical protein